MKLIISKPKKVFLFILSVLVVLIISAILAYLTDKATRDNKFTIGSIEIDLVEESWENLAPEEDLNENGIPDVAEALGPNESVAKDPKVQNIGDNDAYVYLRVLVPKGEVGIDDGDPEMQELFSYEINEDHWVPMDGLTIDGEDYVTYTYYYKKADGDYILNPGAETETLFDEVTLANITDFNGLDLTQQIIVKAYAIQMGDELTVTANPWISEFEEEKNPPPVIQGAKVLNDLSGDPLGVGDDLIVGIEISDEVFGAADGTTPVTESTAPAGTGAIGDGDDFDLEFAGVETMAANIEKNQTLAITSRARANTAVKIILKYKHTIESGEIGEFKIKSFTGGNLYSKTGKKIKIDTVPTFKEEDKIKIEAPVYEIGTRVSVVTKSNGTEYFYVLENSDSSQAKVKLIAEYCLNSSLKQSTSPQTVAFSTEKYWSDITADGTFNYNGYTFQQYNLNEYTIGNDTRMAKATAITRAQNYATTKVGHDATGRLMTGKECEVLFAKNKKLVYGNSIKLVYWLGIADHPNSWYVWFVSGTGTRDMV